MKKTGLTKAILLTAGYGKRLQPLTDFLPKCLIPINGRPLLEYWLRSLIEAGIENILMNLHYLADDVRDYVNNSEYANHITMVYEETLLGTGGTVLRNKDFVADDPVMLIHVDNLCFGDFESFVQAHIQRPRNTDITMMTFTTPTPQTCGILELDEQGIVRTFHEKVANPPGNLANAAVYILEPAVVKFLAALNKPVIDFSTEVLPHFMGRINTFHNKIYHRDIGTIESFMAAQIECPKTFIAPETDNDSWLKYCGKGHRDLSKEILLSLTKHFNADVVELENIEAHNSIPQNNYTLIVHAKNCTIDIKQLISKLKDLFPIKSRTAFLFSKVPSGFSSKDFYEEHGMESVALCACNYH